MFYIELYFKLFCYTFIFYSELLLRFHPIVYLPDITTMVDWV